MEVNHGDVVVDITVPSGGTFNLLDLQIDSFGKGTGQSRMEESYNTGPMGLERINKGL